MQDLSANDKFYHIEVDVDATVEELKCLIAIESTLDPERQVLYYRQAILTDSKRLKDCGITNNDMINLSITNLNQADQDLMANFFNKMNKNGGAKPRMS